MGDQESLGPSEVWQIRAFPRGLREYLATEARRADITVGELLTSIVLAYRDGDSLGKTALTNPVKPALAFPELIALAKSDMPAWLRSPARRELGRLMGVVPPDPPKRRAIQASAASSAA